MNLYSGYYFVSISFYKKNIRVIKLSFVGLINRFKIMDQILPMAIRVAAKTISNDLVDVKPMSSPFLSDEDLNRINAEVRSNNRDGKIDSILDGVDYEEKSIYDHPDYWKVIPKAKLFYLDYVYGATQS